MEPETMVEICPKCKESSDYWPCDGDYYSPASTCPKCGESFDSQYLCGWQECYNELNPAAPQQDSREEGR